MSAGASRPLSGPGFLAIVVTLTWAVWGLARVLGDGAPTPAARGLTLLGLAMPILVTVLVLLLRHGARDRSDFLRRFLSPARIPPPWLALVLGFPLLLFGTAVAVDRLLGGGGPAPTLSTRFPAGVSGVGLLLAPTLLLGSLTGEPAWRGYALDALQARHTTLVSALLLGAVWAIWPLPLHWLAPDLAGSLGLDTAELGPGILVKVPLSVLLAWVYNHTARSILAAVLLHFSMNLVAASLPLPPRAEIIALLLLWAAALAVAVRGGLHTQIAQGEV